MNTRTKVTIAILLALLVGALTQAVPHKESPTTCYSNPQSYIQWSLFGDMASPRLGPVPAGKVWHIRAAGGATTDGSPRDYKMELLVLVNGACCFNVPLEVNLAPVGTTPTIALKRELLMLPGEMMTVRSCCGAPNGQVAIVATYFEWEEGSPCHKGI